jgi:hypothetical protein
VVPDDLLTRFQGNDASMTGIKITLSAAMRARDVSRPRAEDESGRAVPDEEAVVAEGPTPVSREKTLTSREKRRSARRSER